MLTNKDYFELNNENYDIIIDNVKFQKQFLYKIPFFNSYFSKNWKQDEKEIFITNNEEYMSLLKKYIFGIEIELKDLNFEIIVEIYKWSDFLGIIEFYKSIIKYIIIFIIENKNNKKIINIYKNCPNIFFGEINFEFQLNLNTTNDIEINFIGFCYQYGIGCEKDEKKAFELYKENWEKNKNEDSLNNFAFCYHYGIGCKKDEKKAFELYKENWEKNKNSGGLHNFAFCYHYGIGCEKDEKKAFEIYKENWEKNKNSHSLNNLVFCYRHGIGCEKNIKKSIELKNYLYFFKET